MEKDPGRKETMVNNEEAFRAWLAVRQRRDGRLFALATQKEYIRSLKASREIFGKEYGTYAGIFDITDPKEFARIVNRIKSNEEAYHYYNAVRGRGRFAAAVTLYQAFLNGEGPNRDDG